MILGNIWEKKNLVTRGLGKNTGSHWGGGGLHQQLSLNLAVGKESRNKPQRVDPLRPSGEKFIPVWGRTTGGRNLRLPGGYF